MRDLLAARSFLFVPGDRPDRFDKAAASGTDVVILDLEDAVSPSDKAFAREHVRTWIQKGGLAVIRINAVGTEWHDADLDLVTQLGVSVMLAKTESAEEVVSLAQQLRPGAGVLPLIETPGGVLQAYPICAVPGVLRPVLGTIDLAAALGIDPDDHEALSYVRQSLVLAARAAGVDGPVDGITTQIDDLDLLIRQTLDSSRLGFTGKLCIHPRQVQPVHDCFRPSASQLDWARRVVAAFDDQTLTTLDGELIDKPVAIRAQRLLSRG